MDGLTHYTNGLEGLIGILNDGFAWVPNPRNLISKLLPGIDFSEREPQQFGMISFTDWVPPAPQQHRETFGDFGIVVSREWARAKKPLRGFHPDNVKPELRAQRVIYLEDGPYLDASRWLYTTAFAQSDWEGVNFAELSSPTNPLTNKSMAGGQGQALWANLLTLYEYLEDGEYSYESEWRIVHPLPAFGYPSETSEIIAGISPRRGWGQVTDFKSLTPPEKEIIGFVCPRKEERLLRKALPSQLSDRSIVLI